MALRTFEQLTVYPNVVFFGVGFAAQFGDDRTIHRHQATRDELF